MNQDRRKTLVVGVLVVCAVGYVSWTLLGDSRTRVTGQRGSSSAAKLSPAKPGPASSAMGAITKPAQALVTDALLAPGTPLEPAQGVDLMAIESQFVSWVESPRRDPFQLYVAPEVKPKGPRAADVLSLNAIWRQSGGRYAVINKRVLTEGDLVASYRVDRIDASAVWVSGTNGTERLDFRVGAPPARPPQKKTQPGRPATPGDGGTTTTRERKLTP